MASVPVHSDFGVQENKICHCFHFSPFYLPWNDGIRCLDLSFLNAEFQASFFTLFFHHHHDFLLLEWYYLHVGGCWYMPWHFQFKLVIHPVWHFTWGTLHMLNKQGDNIQSCHIPFPVSTSHFSTSSSNCCFFICIQVSQETGKVVWYSHLFFFFL